MTLGKRISLGFGILVLITLVLGTMGTINMRSAATDATKLSDIYAPEVHVANEIFATSNQIRYDMLTFATQENEASLEKVKRGFVELKKQLVQAEELSNTFHLKALNENTTKASKAVAEYMISVEKTEQIIRRKNSVDNDMSSNAKHFLEGAGAYLKSQERKFKQEIEDKSEKSKLLARFEKITHINTVIDMGNEARVIGQRAQLKRNGALLEDAIKKFDAMYALIAQLRANSVEATNLEQLKTIELTAKAYEVSLREISTILHDAAQESQVRIKMANEVLSAAEAVVEIGLKNVGEISKESTQSLNVSSWVMIIGLIVAVVLSIIVALFIIRSIVKIVTEAVKSLSEGTTQVVSASEQISSASVSLAEGASSQASSVEEVSATIEEATASNNQNAENSREANLLAQHSNDAAKVGNQRVQDLMGAMEKITDSSQKIAKIIKTIDEIAFQTNLLALNAAVEAARAGEHGLGFAVVAEEVKNLAERSAGAAKEITGIIESSIDQVKAGTEVANKTKESFTEILNGIKKTSDLIGEIAISAKEQAEGMNQIATAMGSVDQITQQNASASEETAAAAEELNAQALSMLDNVAELALLAGFDMGKENRAPKSSVKRIASPSIAPKRLAMTSKKPSTKPMSTTSRRSNEEVFPLGEEDLKEF